MQLAYRHSCGIMHWPLQIGEGLKCDKEISIGLFASGLFNTYAVFRPAGSCRAMISDGCRLGWHLWGERELEEPRTVPGSQHYHSRLHAVWSHRCIALAVHYAN